MTTIMKKILAYFLALSISTIVSAQEVTKFLGISIDGTKAEMISKLQAKGFQYNPDKDYLLGEFNGEEVKVQVVTDNNKVWRIYVEDVNHRDSYQIRIRFNTLCEQFERNSCYIAPEEKQTIAVNSNPIYSGDRFEACYYQASDEDVDLFMLQLVEAFKMIANYEYSEIPFDMLGGIKISEEDFNRLKFVKDLENPTFNDIKEHIINLCPEDERIKMKDDWDEIYPTVEKLAKYTYGENRPVWFTISRTGDYYISMYYDNKLNRADGSDL